MNAKKHEQARRRRDPAKYWQRREIEALRRRDPAIESLFGAWHDPESCTYCAAESAPEGVQP